MDILKKRPYHPRQAIIFDIDDTLCENPLHQNKEINFHNFMKLWKPISVISSKYNKMEKT